MHILNHALMKGCLFLCAGAFNLQGDLWNIADLRGMGRRLPLTSAAYHCRPLMIGVPQPLDLHQGLLILASFETKQFVFVAVCFELIAEPGLFGRVLETLYMKKVTTQAIPILLSARGRNSDQHAGTHSHVGTILRDPWSTLAEQNSSPLSIKSHPVPIGGICIEAVRSSSLPRG